MTASPKGFQKLISALPKEFKVLDGGSGGLQGENTTEFLIQHFDHKNILGICWANAETKRFLDTKIANNMVTIPIIDGNFYEHVFDQQFDLVVLDMNIENNLANDWSKAGLQRMRGLVKDGGYLINYVMLTDQYGDPNETPEFIRSYWREFWDTEKLTPPDVGRRLSRVPGWELFAYELEERRPYILWVMLKKTNGL